MSPSSHSRWWQASQVFEQSQRAFGMIVSQIDGFWTQGARAARTTIVVPWPMADVVAKGGV
eukprot:7380535-Prymnesium_polylepis.3